MYEKISALRERLNKMKQNRSAKQNGQTFHFSPFSQKQKQVLTWLQILLERYAYSEISGTFILI